MNMYRALSRYEEVEVSLSYSHVTLSNLRVSHEEQRGIVDLLYGG